MSSNADLARAITIYCGIPILVCGTVGNLLNLILLWRSRRNSCAFLFLCSSIFNCFALFFGLFTRILNVGFGLDWSQTNLIWCKIRIAFSEASFLLSLTCICLASVDRCLASCRNATLRKLSRLSTARISILVSIIFWVCHATPNLIFANLLPSSTANSTFVCSITPDQILSNYQTYFSLLVYLGVLPTSILISTGVLTYRNTSKLRLDYQRELIQKQLTNMMLIQIPVILISTVPYIAFSEYRALTSKQTKSASRREIENLVTNIVTLLFYMTFTCQFFVFFFSSPKFRRQLNPAVLCQRRHRVSHDFTNAKQPA